KSAVLCLTAPDLFVQNIRVAKATPEELYRHVLHEVAGRLPFPINEAEVRYLETVDVRQGDSVRREVIVLAIHQPVLEQKLQVITQAGFKPVAVDSEFAALLRCYARQFRRDEDRKQRAMFVNIGAGQTAVVIAEGSNTLFAKYLDLGGRHF